MLVLALWLAAHDALVSFSRGEDESAPVAAAGHGGLKPTTAEVKANPGNIQPNSGAAPNPQMSGTEYSSGGSAGSLGVIDVKTILTVPDQDASGVWRGTREPPSREPEPPAQQAARGPMSLSDARMNFPALVETTVLTRSPDGYWSYPLRGSVPPKRLKLRLQRIEKGSLELLQGTLYQGFALFRDMDSKRLFRMDFTVDYGANDWSVTGHKLNLDEIEDEQAPASKKPAKRKSGKPRAGSKTS